MKTKNTNPGSTTIRLFLTLLTVAFVIFSCQQDEQESILTPVVTTNSDKLKLEFGKSLTTALASEPLVRSFLKQEALKMMDGDFDILYALVKDKKLSNGKTFEEALTPHFGGVDKLRKIEEGLPLLTLFIPSLPENSFSAEKWNAESEIPYVAIRLNTTNDVPIVSPEGKEYILDSELIPSFPIVVIKENERMAVTGQNGFSQAKGERSFTIGSRSYKFVDDLFDNELQSAKQRANLRDVLDSQVDQKLLDAYSIYSNVDGWHRDYIYYNITPTNTVGPIRYDFTEKITYFDIVGSALAVYYAIADQTGDPQIKTGKKSSGWTDGSFEIRANALIQARNGIGPSISNATYITGANLFTVTYNVEKRGVWPFRYDYYTIKTVTSKPQNTNLSIVNWDLNKYASTFRIDIEEADNTEVVTTTNSETVKFASNFEFNTSFGTDVKVGMKYGSSQEQTRTATISRQSTLYSDKLGEFVVNFEDKIVIQDYVYPYQNPSAYTRIRDYSNGTILINVEPRRVQ
jgi:hypothetical protein